MVTISPGHVFARDYRVIRPLSEGGMGAVYVVEQLSTGNQRALKLMHPQLVQDVRLRQRFEQEAHVGARVESDHAVQVLAAGVDDDTGFPFLVMELLKGEDLAAALARRGTFSPYETREIFAQLCHALAAAHAVGVVHRDLKPDNIFLAASHREGASFTVKVLDFGIAKVMAEAQTRQTAAMGTPLWMAPEQTTPSATIGPQTDVWALGLIAFRMLTGRVYWLSGNSEDASTATLMREILIEPVVPASERATQLGVGALLPPGFDGWFSCCVERDPAGRFSEAGAARNALAGLLSAASPASHPAAGVDRTEPLVAARSYAADGPNPAGKAAAYAPPATTPLGMATPQPAIATSTPQRQPYGGPPEPPPAGYPQAPGRTSVGAPGPGAFGGTGHRGSFPGAAPSHLGARASNPGSGPAFQASNIRRKKGSPMAMFAVLGGAALLGAVALIATKLRSANDQHSCEKMVSTAEEGREIIDACTRTCASQPAACATEGELLQRFKLGDAALDRARAAYQKGCDGGEQRACRRLGSVLERTDPGKAAALYKAACDKGDAASCTLLGVLHEEGKSLPRDPVRALALYDTACKASDKLGCAYQSFILFEGLGVKQDEARATELAKDAASYLAMECDSNHPRQCVAVGVMLGSGMAGTKEDARAAELMQKACDADEPAGCANLGVMELFGVGVAKDSKRAIDHLQRACNDGEQAACTGLGLLMAKVMFVVRRGVRGVATLKVACSGPIDLGCAGWGAAYPAPADLAGDPSAAVAISTKACDAGELTACVNLGAFHQYAVGTLKSREKAVELFKRACEGGNGGGCTELAAMYRAGRGVPYDPKHGLELSTQACAFGEKDACLGVGAHKAFGIGIPAVPEEGAAIFRTSCEQQKIAMGCNMYATVLASGLGVKKDVPAAFDLFTRACEGKLERIYPRACVSLGNHWEAGTFGAKDSTAAAKLYQTACDQGDTSGCTALGRLYADGTGVPKDDAKAHALVEAGCKASDAGSCDMLGVFYAVGKAGLTADGAKGIEYLRLACDDASWTSCTSIGVIYLGGIGGVAKDKAAAAKYMQIACSHGVDDACQRMKQNGL
jgi:TPR repeat protein/serine/threonine protein kinase